jgi:hypothetical protein
VEDKGIEPSGQPSKKARLFATAGAESGAVGAAFGHFDADLLAVIEAWPSLPEKVKADILALVKSATS